MVSETQPAYAKRRSPLALRSITEAVFRHKKKCPMAFWFVRGLVSAYAYLRRCEYASTARLRTYPKTRRNLSHGRARTKQRTVLGSALNVRVGREAVTADPTAASGQVITFTETKARADAVGAILNRQWECLHRWLGSQK